MASGVKFGKTEAGAVWLSAELTSPFRFYQFWLNVDDRDVSGYLRVFSFRSREEIEELEKAAAERPAAREAQRALADELTVMVHGEAQRDAVVAASQALFGRGELGGLDAATLGGALAELPRTSMTRDPEGRLPLVVDLLAESGLSPSKSAARRAVAEGGAYVNNVRVGDPEGRPSDADLLHGRWLVLRRGKRSLAAAELV
jgi:tyrosyl-tRNA synthetase